ncbi:hypothetical protein AB0M39_18450 [Streptomyces sp. NPDC051907]|uniref:hypothetical protein n=1 Tax=Streptomyces sp. NPDC051907 TaxID=3155284 RepID=UPI00343FD0EA
MRPTAHLLIASALAVASMGIAAHAAYASDVERLEVHPSTVSPGDLVTVNTTACGRGGRGVGDARALGAGEFQLEPGTHKEVVVGQFRVPDHAKAGTYGIAVACDNGKTAGGDLVVEHRSEPSGHVRTGVGGSVGPDVTQIAVGAAVLAAAAVGGTVLLRRRASGAQGS